jgi:phosphate transport system substrate-binding protein
MPDTHVSRRIFLSACVGAFVCLRGRADTPAPALPVYAQKTQVAGTLRFSGADTMHDLVAAWAHGFAAFQPRVAIDNAATKLSADGFDALLDGRADVVTFVREPFPAELAAFARKFGYAPTLIHVAGGSYATKSGTHALAIFVHAHNPLTRISLDALDSIYSKHRRRGGNAITTWGQLGGGGDWKSRPIHIYGMPHRRATGNPPGIVNFFQQRVLRGGEFRDDIREQTDRPGETALDAIVHRIAADPLGIGYSGFAYAAPGAKTLALAETQRGPWFAGTPDEVARHDYPLSRQIYLGFNRAPGEPLAPALHEFLLFVLSRQGQQDVANDRMRFLPLTPEQADVSRRGLG